jgi:hypothetical protein
MKILSKSKFVSGVQCQKKLWLELFRPELKPPLDASKEKLFATGHEIGKLAWMKFPGGKDVTPESYSQLSESIEKTKKWLGEGVQSIYEASFSAENAFCMLDILHREEDKLWAVEVKNSTQVKDYHLTDAALQFWTLNQSGFQPDRFFLMHINNQYVKQGEITEELFQLTDITQEVLKLQPFVSEKLKELNEVTLAKNEPEKEIGPHCSNPFGCDFQHYCWADVPENSVFELTRVGAKAWDLYNSGIQRMEDIPEDFPLSDSQILQVRGLKFQETYADVPSILNFLENWEYPLHFFDFETIMPAIPILDGTRPYQQIPFQYSLHILEENQSVIHTEFLASPADFHRSDPRKLLIEQLKKDFRNSGSIVTYNKSFEVGRLKELAEAFPEDARFLEGLIDRIVDLYDVFRSRWYYHPAMKNSASIKSVLPALIPEFSYSDLEIGDGGTASELFLESIQKNSFSTPELQKNLLKYCERDTYAMVLIYQFLQKLEN